MKLMQIAFIVLYVFATHTSTFAQTEEVKQKWIEQIDTNHVNLLKSEYLQVEKSQAMEQFDKQLSFGMYKDNYFITGVPTNKAINNLTADAKFQISIRQRLIKSIMPFETQLMLIYTQKSFWNIYDESSPFADNNYNPGLLLIKPVIDKNQLLGVASFSFEHESNGRQGLESRSWNYFTLSGIYFFNAYFYAQVKLWYGWIGGENPDLFDYRGYGLVALNYRSFNDKFGVSFVINPCKETVNTQLELTFQPNKNANQYLFLQWYQGYGESLLEYNQYASMVRIGICIKPAMRNLY
jgi:Outer membrane phospholipase A